MSIPGGLNYPTSLDDAVSLIESADYARTTLTATYFAGASSLAVLSTSLFPSSGLLTLLPSGLILRYTGKTSTSFTGVARATNETNNPADANVAAGQAVEQRITSRSLGVLRSAVLALETKLGIGVDAPLALDEFLKGTGVGTSGWSSLTSGNVTAALGYTPPNFYGKVVIAHDMAGADLGAQINAADALLGASAGTILVLSPTSTISTAVSISPRHLLKFGPGAYIQSNYIGLNGSGAAVEGSGEETTIINNTSLTIPSIKSLGAYVYLRVSNMTLDRPVRATLAGGGNGVDLGGFTSHYANISGLRLTNHDNGIVLGPVVYGRAWRIYTGQNAGVGMLMRNTAATALTQWELSDWLSEGNGSHGYLVQSFAGPASQNTLGDWFGLHSFGNTGHGVAVVGISSVPVQGVRMHGCFFGGDADDEIYLDTYGTDHLIDNCFTELAGRGTTGPAGATTGASNIGRGIHATANNVFVQIVSSKAIEHAYSGIRCDAQFSLITDCKSSTNGNAGVGGEQAGIRVIASSWSTIDSNFCHNISGTPQKYGIYSDNDKATIVGNTVDGVTEAIAISGPVNSTVWGNTVLSGVVGRALNYIPGVPTLSGAVALTAGGAKVLGLGAAGPHIYEGSGVPTVTAPKGSLYLRSDGTTTTTRMYVNTDGGTTWTNVVTSA